MRIRTIKPEFWSHPVMARLDAPTQLLALGLLNYADDDGYFYADPVLVAGALRPFAGMHGVAGVREDLKKLQRCGWIVAARHKSHGLIGRVVKFSKHQRINRRTPSKISEYLSEQLRDPLTESLTEDAVSDSHLEGKGTGKGSPCSPPVGDGSPSCELQLEGQNGEHSVVEGLLLRAMGLFGRRVPLDSAQVRAWKKKETRAAMAATSEEDWETLAWFYGVDPEVCRDARFRRHDLAQLLNNWGGEVGKANQAAQNFGRKKKAAPEEQVPEWRDLLTEANPEFPQPGNFWELDQLARDWVRQLKKEREEKQAA